MTLLLLRCRARMAWTLLKPGSRKDWGYRILIAVLAPAAHGQQAQRLPEGYLTAFACEPITRPL